MKLDNNVPCNTCRETFPHCKCCGEDKPPFPGRKQRLEQRRTRQSRGAHMTYSPGDDVHWTCPACGADNVHSEENTSIPSCHSCTTFYDWLTVFARILTEARP